MTGSSARRWLFVGVLGGALLAPTIAIGSASSSAAISAVQMIHARGRGPGPAPARRAPRRSVRHGHRHDHYDDVRRARRGRTIARGVTTIAVGTRVRTLPRHCTVVVTDDIAYRVCDDVYYRRYYEGTTVVYVVVEAP